MSQVKETPVRERQQALALVVVERDVGTGVVLRRRKERPELGYAHSQKVVADVVFPAVVLAASDVGLRKKMPLRR